MNDKKLEEEIKKMKKILKTYTLEQVLTGFETSDGDEQKEWKKRARTIIANRGVIISDWKGCWRDLMKRVDSVGASAPIRIDEKIYDHFLGSVPPAEMGSFNRFERFPRGVKQYFLNGEPWTIGWYDTFVYDELGEYWYMGQYNKTS